MSKNNENSNDMNNGNPFSLPDGYFGSFGKKMMHKLELAEELKEFKVLSSIEKKLPFVTPDNYFASSDVKSELSLYPNLSSLSKQNGFVTPESYFETSLPAIKSRIEIADELKMYPTLYSLNKENSFVAPGNYFDELSHRLREDISPAKEENGTVKILHLIFSKKTAYAIAAMLVISLGLYVYNSAEETTVNDCNTLACLQKQDIKTEYLLNIDDEDALMESVNVEALTKSLQENLKQTKKEGDAKSDKETKEDYVLENVDVNDIVDEI